MWSSCAGNMRPQRNASTNCERGPPLALEHAILVSLLEEPLTGYELAKKFDSSVGFFWKASHQQIYLSLKKLRDRELIGATRVNQTDRPNKVVYHIADGGIEEVRQWALREGPPAPMKEDLMVKLFALDTIDLLRFLEQIRQRHQWQEKRLALYERIRERHYRDPASLTLAARGRYLSLQAGIRTCRLWLQWCEDALELLAPGQEGLPVSSPE